MNGTIFDTLFTFGLAVYFVLVFGLVYTAVTEGKTGNLRFFFLTLLGLFVHPSQMWNDEIAWYSKSNFVKDFPKNFFQLIKVKDGEYLILQNSTMPLFVARYVLFVGVALFVVATALFVELSFSLTIFRKAMCYVCFILVVLNTLTIAFHFGAKKVIGRFIEDKKKAH